MAAGPTPDDRRLADGQPGERSGPSRAFWLVPALTFAVGLLLGALVIAAATSGDDADPPGRQAMATPEPTPAAEGDLEIVVPASCLQAAEQAEEVVEIMNRGVVAAGDLDAEAVQAALDELVEMRPTIEALIDQCREAAAAEVTN